jgi:hypothetical protein
MIDQKRINLTTKAWPLLMGAMALWDLIRLVGI